MVIVLHGNHSGFVASVQRFVREQERSYVKIHLPFGKMRVDFVYVCTQIMRRLDRFDSFLVMHTKEIIMPGRFPERPFAQPFLNADRTGLDRRHASISKGRVESPGQVRRAF